VERNRAPSARARGTHAREGHRGEMRGERGCNRADAIDGCGTTRAAARLKRADRSTRPIVRVQSCGASKPVDGTAGRRHPPIPNEGVSHRRGARRTHARCPLNARSLRRHDGLREIGAAATMSRWATSLRASANEVTDRRPTGGRHTSHATAALTRLKGGANGGVRPRVVADSRYRRGLREGADLSGRGIGPRLLTRGLPHENEPMGSSGASGLPSHVRETDQQFATVPGVLPQPLQGVEATTAS
jgi:hypothetical protein